LGKKEYVHFNREMFARQQDGAIGCDQNVRMLVGSRTGMYDVEKRKFLTIPGFDL
jgi:hypothetical protein